MAWLASRAVRPGSAKVRRLLPPGSIPQGTCGLSRIPMAINYLARRSEHGLAYLAPPVLALPASRLRPALHPGPLRAACVSVMLVSSILLSYSTAVSCCATPSAPSSPIGSGRPGPRPALHGGVRAGPIVTALPAGVPDPGPHSLRGVGVAGVRIADPKVGRCSEALEGVIRPCYGKVSGPACKPGTPLGVLRVSSKSACAAVRDHGHGGGALAARCGLPAAAQVPTP